jgi:acetoin utilization deacetylase AcuC-like enzyme
VHHGDGTQEGFFNDSQVFFGSVHIKDMYPYEMKQKKQKEFESTRIVNRCYDGGALGFRDGWTYIIKKMIDFEPQLVLISAGFDGHKDDRFGGMLSEHDYEWATDVVMDACLKLNPLRPPPVVSVLEGGYNCEANAKCALRHVAALDRTRGSYALDDTTTSALDRTRGSYALDDTTTSAPVISRSSTATSEIYDLTKDTPEKPGEALLVMHPHLLLMPCHTDV